jgi:hypothetical protein
VSFSLAGFANEYFAAVKVSKTENNSSKKMFLIIVKLCECESQNYLPQYNLRT